jgi:hypothetical protein
VVPGRFITGVYQFVDGWEDQPLNFAAVVPATP